jgi:hypothetical protein
MRRIVCRSTGLFIESPLISPGTDWLQKKSKSVAASGPSHCSTVARAESLEGLLIAGFDASCEVTVVGVSGYWHWRLIRWHESHTGRCSLHLFFRLRQVMQPVFRRVLRGLF